MKILNWQNLITWIVILGIAYLIWSPIVKSIF